ncbi:MAG: NCS2 family permease [Chlamydiales bacterium]
MFKQFKGGKDPRIKEEILAGISIFLILSHLVFLVPTILSQGGIDFGGALVATALMGAYGSFMMGRLANYPFVLGPSLAMSGYFTYSLVLKEGYSWEHALGCIFLTGVILLFLNLLHIRQFMIRMIPRSLRLGVTAGLGCFLGLIGLKSAGIIHSDPGHLIVFASCPPMDYMIIGCGILIISMMLACHIRYAWLFGILIMWIFSLVFGWVEYQGILSLPSSLTPNLFKLEILPFFEMKHFDAILSLLLMSLFESNNILVGLAQEGGFLQEKKGDLEGCLFPRLSRALIPDTTGTILAPILGLSSLTFYPESLIGMRLGGSSGLTAVTASCLFLITPFFTPLLSSITFVPITPVLLLLGWMMLRTFSQLKWDDLTEWLPAIITSIFIFLTFSILNGITVGYLSYCLLKLLSGRLREVHWLSWGMALLFILKWFYFSGI